MDKYFLGLDIGGTNVRIAILDENKNPVGGITRAPFERLGTPQEEVEKNICGLIHAAMKKNNLEEGSLQGIGIGMAALFDRKSGDITSWPNNRLWEHFPFKKYLMQKFNVPIIMEDDANSAGLGEYRKGAGRGFRNFAYITIGTGIGCGLILDGSIYTGASGWAGEVGHIKVTEGGPLCKCGAMGCLQSLVSGPALFQRSRELSAQAGEEVVNLSGLEDVAGLARKGVPWALKVFEEAGIYLSEMITTLAIMLDIPLIVIGGGVAQAGEILLKPIKSAIRLHNPQLAKRVNIVPAALGDDSGVTGALHLIYDHMMTAGDLCKNRETDKKNIAVINGPNINMLGAREPLFYGNETWDSIKERLVRLAEELNVYLTFFQSNHEGSIVDFIQENICRLDGVVINPAAYTKTGYAILDALTSVDIPFVEVHLSNIFSRGGWHSQSVFSDRAVGQIAGFRGYSYECGLRALFNHINTINRKKEEVK